MGRDRVHLGQATLVRGPANAMLLSRTLGGPHHQAFPQCIADSKDRRDIQLGRTDMGQIYLDHAFTIGKLKVSKDNQTSSLLSRGTKRETHSDPHHTHTSSGEGSWSPQCRSGRGTCTLVLPQTPCHPSTLPPTQSGSWSKCWLDNFHQGTAGAASNLIGLEYFVGFMQEIIDTPRGMH